LHIKVLYRGLTYEIYCESEIQFGSEKILFPSRKASEYASNEKKSLLKNGRVKKETMRKNIAIR
jgi:hypothetical protein